LIGFASKKLEFSIQRLVRSIQHPPIAFRKFISVSVVKEKTEFGPISSIFDMISVLSAGGCTYVFGKILDKRMIDEQQGRCAMTSQLWFIPQASPRSQGHMRITSFPVWFPPIFTNLPNWDRERPDHVRLIEVQMILPGVSLNPIGAVRRCR
jgi:hypothetical protein